jgi:hypothetical protein
LVGLDASGALLATVVARYVRFGAEHAELMVRSVTIPYSLLAVAIVPTWLAVLALGRCYDIGPFGTGTGPRRVIRAGANFMAVAAVAYYVLQVENLRRGFLAVAVVMAVVSSLALRILAARYLRARRREGRGRRRALVVGSRPTVAAVVRRLALRRGAELTPVGACVPDPDRPLVVNERPVPLHGGLDDVLPAVHASGADVVVLTGSQAHGRVQRLAWALEGTGVDVFVVPALAQRAVELDVRPVAGLPLVYVNQGRRPVPLLPIARVPAPAPAPAPVATTADQELDHEVATNGVAAATAASPAAGRPAPRPPATGVSGTNGTNGAAAGRGAYRARPAARRPSKAPASH